KYATNLTYRLGDHIEALAKESGRPSTYLYSSAESKEELARQVAKQDGITEGLIGVWRCVEPCFTFEVGPNGKTKRWELRRRWLKCSHYYLYFIDPIFGF